MSSILRSAAGALRYLQVQTPKFNPKGEQQFNLSIGEKIMTVVVVEVVAAGTWKHNYHASRFFHSMLTAGKKGDKGLAKPGLQL